MIDKLKNAIRKFRLENPGATSGFTDEQVLEAMFLVLSRQHPSRVSLVGSKDGQLKFRIRLAADASDAC
jgi:hypothetical protein